MIDSRCGLCCTGCAFRESHNCGRCIDTMGHPFHGACPIAACCQAKGLDHCGLCDSLPCENLYVYSYTDPEHGDNPPGARVARLRRWAAEGGARAWRNVLLTSAGFYDWDGNPRKNLIARFLDMLGTPPAQARVLFVPTAAIDEGAKAIAEMLLNVLVNMGIEREHIRVHDVDGTLTPEEAMTFDAVLLTGGDTAHLLRRIKETGFDNILKRMVYAGKTYVGVSAGSIIATPNTGSMEDTEGMGLALADVRLSVHRPKGTKPETGGRLPHVPLTDDQALVARWDGYEVIEG